MPPCSPTRRTGSPGAQPREGGTNRCTQPGHRSGTRPLWAPVRTRTGPLSTSPWARGPGGPAGPLESTELDWSPLHGASAGSGGGPGQGGLRSGQPSRPAVGCSPWSRQGRGPGQASGLGSGPRLSSDPHRPPDCAPGHHPIQTPPPDRCSDSRAGEARGACEGSMAAPPASRGRRAHAGRGPRQAGALSSPHGGVEARPPGLGRGPHRENGAPAAPRVSSGA